MPDGGEAPMSNETFSRVLIVSSEPFNMERGTGITLSNLFRGWPADRLACLYYLPLTPDASVCTRHIRLSADTEASPTTPVQPASDRSPARESFLRRLRRWLNRVVGISPWLAFRRQLPATTAEWVRAYQPDCIYCPISGAPMVTFLQQIKALLPAVPVVAHVYDDWISVAGNTGALTGPLWGAVMRRMFTAVLREADACLAIGEVMAQEYARRYGLSFQAFQNPPETQPWLRYGKQEWTAGTPFCFRFTGNIYDGGNLQALLTFAEMVEAVCQGGTPAVLELYVPPEALAEIMPAFSAYPHVSLYPTVASDDAMAQLYGRADALVLAYNADQRGGQWMRFSMPTKIPTILVSGVPLVVSAPHGSAVETLVREHACGCLLATDAPLSARVSQLTRFIADDALRAEQAQRGRELALSTFTADVVRPRFRQVLTDVVSRRMGHIPGEGKDGVA
jgi:hypothetical protein